MSVEYEKIAGLEGIIRDLDLKLFADKQYTICVTCDAKFKNSAEFEDLEEIMEWGARAYQPPEESKKEILKKMTQGLMPEFARKFEFREHVRGVYAKSPDNTVVHLNIEERKLEPEGFDYKNGKKLLKVTKKHGWRVDEEIEKSLKLELIQNELNLVPSNREELESIFEVYKVVKDVPLETLENKSETLTKAFEKVKKSNESEDDTIKEK